MERLWRSGPGTVGEVRDALNGPDARELAYTTVLTILLRLHEKGYVTRTREGRHYRYAAAFEERQLAAEVGRRELRRLIERHGAASLAGFARDLAGADSELVKQLRALGERDREA
jgi:predicted transcriptional regulator